MKTFLVAIALGCAATHGENLLANPDFEQVWRGMPRQWKLFVMAQEGAEGRLDDEVAFSERHSVMLHTALAYEEEPANNWSQPVIADLAGKDLLVRGHIKTEEAAEAAIWVQCFRTGPDNRLQTLQAATTNKSTPVYGTTDWAPVEMRVRVPDGTDFVMFRCVLMGTGTAWFDDLLLAEEPAKEKDDSVDTDKDIRESRQEEAAAAEKEALKSLLETNRVLVETSRVLRESNDALSRQVRALQEELQALREGLAAIEAQPPPEAPKPAPPVAPTPPLVPHGYPLGGTQ